MLKKSINIAILILLGCGLYLSVFYFLQENLYSQASSNSAKFILVSFLISGFLSTIQLVINRNQLVPSPIIYAIAIVFLAIITLILGYDWFKQNHFYLTPLGFRNFLFLLCLLPTITWIAFYIGHGNKTSLNSTGYYTGCILISIFIIFSLLMIISPLQLYYRELLAIENSDPSSISIFGRLIISLVLIGIVYFILKAVKLYRPWMAILFSAIAFYLFARLYLINTSGLRIDVGNVFWVTKNMPIAMLLKDYLLILAAVSLAYILVTKAVFKALISLAFVALVSYLGLYFEYSKIDENHIQSPSKNIVESPKLQLSSNGKNQFVFFLDEYQGSVFYDLLQDGKIKASDFEGFSFYPNSLSVGTVTLHSTAAMLGGNDFTPDKILKRDQKANFRKEISKAYDLLFSSFHEDDFEINVTGMIYNRCDNLNAKLSKNCQSHIFNWMNPLDIQKQVHAATNAIVGEQYWYDLFVSLIRMGPKSLQQFMSKQLPGNSNKVAISKMARYWLGFDNLKNLFQSGAKDNTFNFIYTSATHSPFVLNEQCQIDVKPTTRHNATLCVTQSLIRFLNFLKAHSLYDNSSIIVISDHGVKGRAAKNSMVIKTSKGSVSESEIANRHTLTLIKPIGRTGPLKTNPQLVSAADYPKFICAIKKGCSFLTNSNNNNQQELTTFNLKESVDHISGEKRFQVNQKYTVKNSIFNRANWIEK